MAATVDIGLTHVALTVTNPEASIAFYRKYAGMQVVHRRIDAQPNFRSLGSKKIFWPVAAQ
jgi:catechol 2,3-dioxygenase-like lactoylglutathione lyase family enzyme